MNKKRIILGLLIAVMSVFICGVKNNAPTVFATEISENKITDEAGTYSGEGWHVFGSLVTLKAEMNPGYKFDMWKRTTDTDVDYIYDMEAEFEAERNVTITPFWHKIAYTVSVDGIHLLNSAEMNYFLRYGVDLGVNSIAFCSETQGDYIARQTYKLEENADYDPTDESSKPYKWTITNEVNIAETLFAKLNMELSVVEGEKHKLLNDINDPLDDKYDTDVKGLKLYSDKVDIIIEPRDDVYVYDIAESDIKINNRTLAQIKNSTNTMDISNTIVNEVGVTGFEKLTLNVGRLEQSLNLTASVTYMHKLTLESGNTVDFEEIKEFIGVAFYYSELTEDTVYLVKNEVGILLNNGNDIYQLQKSVFNDEDPTDLDCFKASRILSLSEDSVLKILYTKKGYAVDFATYIQSESGNNVLLETSLYNIPSMQLTPGENIELSYDSADKSVTIDGVKYDFPSDTYGYNFVGFEVNDTLINDGKFILSETEPANTEIQIVFEYIEYGVEIEIIDEYFNADYSYTLSTSKLIKGTEITFTASTEKFQIVGWSLKSNPTASDYLTTANEGDSTLNYIYTFEPESDETYTLTMYLDITYRYLSVEYSLANSSIGSETATNVKYDIVKHDEANNELIFIDSSEHLVEEIVYEESDKIEDVDSITIATNNDTFGNVVIYINDNTMTYGAHGFVSEVGTETDGVWQYTFEKTTTTEYIYYGSLTATVVEAIKFTYSGTIATFSLIGTQFSAEKASGQSDVTIEADVTLGMTETAGAYKIDEYHYTMYFYPSENRISLRGINFYKDGDTNTYKLQYSGERKNIVATIEKDDAYSITLNNLLENHIVAYQTISLDEDFYQFSSFKNKNSSTLWSFVLDGVDTCYLKALDYSVVVANYNMLSQSILLRINNELAYKDAEGNSNQIEYFVNGVVGDGAEISAKAGDAVVISIEQAKIAKGYKFVQFRFMNNVYQPTISEEKYTYSFTMDESYANKYFDIEFEQIKYNLNILYVDKDGKLITDATNVKGSLKLQNGNLEYEDFNSGIVTIENVYKFKAVADEGYYVAMAYIGGEADTIESLQSNNNETSCETVWILSNIDNVFQTVICDNAGEYDSENDCYNVNLKIYFAIHTYSVKVYYEIESKAGRINYPSLEMNGVESEFKEVGIEGGQKEYFAYADGFEYNSAIELVLSNFMKGTSLKQWQDGSENGTYNIASITQNMELIVTLQYIEYIITFEAFDEDGQKTTTRGGGATEKTAYKLFDIVKYDITTTHGYKLQRVYYNNASGNESNMDLDETSFNFNPANFTIEGNKITIFLVFDIRAITLQLANQRSDEGLNPLSENVSEWLNYTVTRKRDGKEEVLKKDYIFCTGDELILDIKPIYAGIVLDKAHLGPKEIGKGTNEDTYKLSSYKSIKSGEVIGEGYTLTVRFVSSLMAELGDVVDLVNYVKLRTYNIDYSYNLINFGQEHNFGVILSVGNETTGSLSTSHKDVKYTEVVIFNSKMTFSYDKESMGNQFTNKFVITGFNVCGEEYEYDVDEGALILKDVEKWNSLALNRFLNNSSNIQIVLMLAPKIELNNADSEKPYIYNKIYNAQEQGFVVGSDIVVVEGFTLTIKYNDSEDLPINAGEYKVTITAALTGGAGTINISLDEHITYIISPAPITITIKSPLSKVYDRSNRIDDKKALVEKLEFNGVKGNDKLTVDINKLTAYYSDYMASDKLISISINNLVLLEKSEMIPSTNYIISNGEDIVLDKAGKITQRELFIGFTAADKVFDNTNAITVNIDDIEYQNKIEGDIADINTDALKFYLDNFSVGFARQVKLDAEEALTGSDRANYKITYGSKGTYAEGKYKNIYIDIYPREISYTVKNYGTFKIVDTDKKCLIPINANMIVKVYENGSEEFQHMYSKVQLEMSKNEKMKYCYKVALVVGGVEQIMPEGLQIYLPKAKKATQVHQQTSDSENIQEVKFASNNDYIVVKTERGRCVFAVVVDTTFLPLWAIILIVTGSLLAVSGIVTVFIVVRVKAKRKYGSYDKI